MSSIDSEFFERLLFLSLSLSLCLRWLHFLLIPKYLWRETLKRLFIIACYDHTRGTLHKRRRFVFPQQHWRHRRRQLCQYSTWCLYRILENDTQIQSKFLYIFSKRRWRSVCEKIQWYSSPFMPVTIFIGLVLSHSEWQIKKQVVS